MGKRGHRAARACSRRALACAHARTRTQQFRRGIGEPLNLAPAISLDVAQVRENQVRANHMASRATDAELEEQRQRDAAEHT